MLIKITSRTLTSTDPFVTPTAARTPSVKEILSHWVVVPFGCYVLLEADSPKVGVAYKISLSPQPVVVLHCEETKRSCLIVAQEFLLMQNYDAHIAAVTRGASKPLVQALLLHVAAEQTFISSLSSNVRSSAARSKARIEIDTHRAPKQISAMLLERGTGAVTWLLAPPHIKFNSDWWPEPDVEVAFPALCAALEAFRKPIDAVNGLGLHPIPCLYDGKAYPARLPILSNETRTVLALIKREMAAALKSGRTPEHGWWLENMKASLGPGTAALAGMESDLRGMLMPMWLFGPVCTICAKGQVSLQCSGCRVEYYCSVEHQRADWPHHKGW